MLTIYHNTRCSKSRQTLALIEEYGSEFTVIEYLKKPINEDKIKALLTKLNCSAIEMMRTKEKEFSELSLKGANEQTLIAAMVSTPKLIERPIVENESTAIIGRPPENVCALFEK